MNIQSLTRAQANAPQSSGASGNSFASAVQQARTGAPKGNGGGCDLQQIQGVLAQISTLIEKLLNLLKTMGVPQGGTTSAPGTTTADSSAGATSMVPDYAPAIDENGNQVFIDSQGNIVDAAGNPVAAETGDAPEGTSMVPDYAPAIDANGNQVFIDSQGNIVDAAGNPVPAESGQILTPEEVPQVVAYPTDGSDTFVNSEGHMVSA